MSTLNKYKLNRFDSYCKFKKYEKFQPMSSIFVLSIIILPLQRLHSSDRQDTILTEIFRPTRA